jgi:hypothetical protein
MSANSESGELFVVVSWPKADTIAIRAATAIKMVLRPPLDTKVAREVNSDCLIDGFGPKNRGTVEVKAVLMPFLPASYVIRDSSGSRMKPPMYFPQSIARHMGVDLRGADVGVAEQFLNHPQICAVFEQVRGKTVPKHVRGDVALDAGPADPIFNAEPERYGGE